MTLKFSLKEHCKLNDDRGYNGRLMPPCIGALKQDLPEILRLAMVGQECEAKLTPTALMKVLDEVKDRLDNPGEFTRMWRVIDTADALADWHQTIVDPKNPGVVKALGSVVDHLQEYRDARARLTSVRRPSEDD